MDYIYELSPTDAFLGFTYVGDITEEERKYYEKPEIESLVKKAEYLFTEYTSYEGRGIVYISALPLDTCNFPLLFVTIKQSHAGWTYLMSPIRLNHLEENLVCSVKIVKEN